jgi:hypothetical protein
VPVAEWSPELAGHGGKRISLCLLDSHRRLRTQIDLGKGIRLRDAYAVEESDKLVRLKRALLRIPERRRPPRLQIPLVADLPTRRSRAIRIGVRLVTLANPPAQRIGEPQVHRMPRREQILPVNLIDHPVFDRIFRRQHLRNCACFLSCRRKKTARSSKTVSVVAASC